MTRQAPTRRHARQTPLRETARALAAAEALRIAQDAAHAQDVERARRSVGHLAQMREDRRLAEVRAVAAHAAKPWWVRMWGR